MNRLIDAYKNIRFELAYIYWESAEARRLTLEAGLDPTRIALSEKPIRFWNDVLLQAIQTNRTKCLLDNACSDRPGLESLKKGFLDLLETCDPGVFESEDEKLPFPLKKDFLDIVSAIQDGILVPVLGPSINPTIYLKLLRHLARLVAGVDIPENRDAEERLRTYYEFVKKHFGSSCSICHFLPELRPDLCPNIEGRADAECPLFHEQMLSVAKASCRSLSQLYQLQKNTPLLYSVIEPYILNASDRPNRIHLVLARLLKGRTKTSRNQEPGQGLAKRLCLPFPLIITTNWDDSLEREFRRQGIAYDLLCGMVSEDTKRGKWIFMGYGVRGEPVTITRKTKKPPFHLGEPFGSDPQPRVIIVKIFGTVLSSIERADGGATVRNDFFIITQEQMELFASKESFENIHNELAKVIKQANALFLGFSPNDPDLRAIIHCLYGQEHIEKPSWIVHQCAAGMLDQAIWRDCGLKLLPVDESLEQTIIDIEGAISDVSQTGTV